MNGLAEILEYNERLRQESAEKDRQIAKLEAQLKVLIEWRERVEAQQQRPKSERFISSLNQEQLPFDVVVNSPKLELETEEQSDELTSGSKSKKHKAKRRKLSDNTKLKRRKVHCPVDLSVCPECNRTMRAAGNITSYRAEWIPGHFIIDEVVRERCRCGHCSNTNTYAAPEPYFLPRALCGNGLLARVLIDKFAYHMPLHRTCTRMKREGLEFSTSTLSGWVAQSTKVLVRISDAIHNDLMLSSWIQGDDTGHPIQDGSDGKLRKGRLWVFANYEQAWYGFTPTKEGSYPAQLLANFEGKILLADAGSEFNQAVSILDILRAGCWSHVRHYFLKSQTHHPIESDIALTVIRELFMIEREIKELSLSERLAQRKRKSEPIIDELMRWAKEVSTATLPSNQLTKACNYLINQEIALRLFLTHPEIPIHNNLSELMLRHNVVGRKNWLFSGSEGGAKAAAVMFTLIGSCSLLNIDPMVYLLDILGRIQSHPVNRIAELTPKRWLEQKNRQS